MHPPTPPAMPASVSTYFCDSLPLGVGEAVIEDVACSCEREIDRLEKVVFVLVVDAVLEVLEAVVDVDGTVLELLVIEAEEMTEETVLVEEKETTEEGILLLELVEVTPFEFVGDGTNVVVEGFGAAIPVESGPERFIYYCKMKAFN